MDLGRPNQQTVGIGVGRGVYADSHSSGSTESRDYMIVRGVLRTAGSKRSSDKPATLQQRPARSLVDSANLNSSPASRGLRGTEVQLHEALRPAAGAANEASHRRSLSLASLSVPSAVFDGEWTLDRLDPAA